MGWFGREAEGQDDEDTDRGEDERPAEVAGGIERAAGPEDERENDEGGAKQEEGGAAWGGGRAGGRRGGAEGSSP